MYSIAIIDDDLIVRKMLSDFFQQSEKIECVMAVESVEKFVKFHRDFLEIKLVLLDLKLENELSCYKIPLIKNREPDIEIIMYTISDDYTHIFQSLCNGATGYITKGISLSELEEKMVAVLEGEGALISPAIARRIISYFNPSLRPPNLELGEEFNSLQQKEIAIMSMLKDGVKYADIAKHLGITINGVRYYVKSIYKKLEINSRNQLP